MQNRLFTYNIRKSADKFRRKLRKTIDVENIDDTKAHISDYEFDVHISEGIFLHSLHYMKENDIELNETAKNIKNPKPDILRYAVLAVCAFVFVYSGYNVVTTLLSYVQAHYDNKEIRNIFFSEETASTDLSKAQMTKASRPLQDYLSSLKQTAINQPAEAEYSERISEIDQNKIKLQRLNDINPDTYGWIWIPFGETKSINYPVVQAVDNDYYLTHDFYKNNQKSGAIFTDYRNSRNVDENLNTIIYGHNMGDQTMFRPLLYFANDAELFNGGVVELYTYDAIYRYTVFSVYETYADSRGAKYSFISTEFVSNEQYVDFLNELVSKSNFESQVNLTAESRIITLATCTNNLRNTRFAVHGVLTEVIR